MSEKQTRKNLFQSALNAVSNRDEKASLEAALKKMDEIEDELDQTKVKLSAAEKKAAEGAQKAVSLQDSLTKAQAELAATKKQLADSQAQVTQAETRIRVLSNQIDNIQASQMQVAQAAATAAAAEEEAKKRIIAEHTLKADETLSHLALKYYGSAYEPYWRVIYEANKDLIGPNPARVRPGMVIKIPVKPENLK